ncbi:hypothetical protein [Chryseobacterium sp.]|uniref:hypothetical protein n=1 Tax=Chryseobacterium sp. TaxID=1871047 RepID=UPI002849A59E|nr:hypothetical protein [Chryseobacterium sp.]MDR3026025.1 hypothetical protein [Chryseobacterium sp.]
MKAELSQSKLKWSNDEVLERFATRVILYIDPKFPDSDSDIPPEEDPFSDYNIAKNKIKDYGKRCDLTEDEYLLALNFASKGILVVDDQIVKIYREINQINLAEIERGYTDFKIRDQKHQNSKNEIRKFLNPPQPKLTPEEYRTLTLSNIRKDYHRFKADGKVLATSVFYDLIKNTGIVKVKLEFVEKFLKNFVPEVAEGKLGSDGTSLPKVIKKDVFVEFQNEMINHYIIHLELHQTIEEEWIKHWETLLIKS